MTIYKRACFVIAALVVSACPDQHPAGALPVEGEEVRWGQDDAKNKQPPASQPQAMHQGSEMPPSMSWVGGKPAGGRVIFTSTCARCHGEQGKASTLDDGSPVPELSPAGLQKKTDRDLARHIAHGHGAMPGFMDQLNRQQLMDLIALLRTGLGSAAAAAPTSQPSTTSAP